MQHGLEVYYDPFRLTHVAVAQLVGSSWVGGSELGMHWTLEGFEGERQNMANNKHMSFVGILNLLRRSACFLKLESHVIRKMSKGD